MANVAEISEFTAGVYQLEVTDPVEGGADGISNYQARALANRTKWLKDRGDDMQTEIDQVEDDLSEEILDRIAAETEINRYLPKRRGFFTGLDIGGSTVGTNFTVGGGVFASATVIADGSVRTNVLVTLSVAMPGINYRLGIHIESRSGDIDNDNAVFAPVFRIISASQFQISFREGSTQTQNLRVHIEVFNLS